MPGYFTSGWLRTKVGIFTFVRSRRPSCESDLLRDIRYLREEVARLYQQHHAELMERTEGLLPETLWPLRDCEEELIRLLISAVRAGLYNHPEVWPWLESQRALGNYELLRHARSKVETGVKSVWTKEEFEEMVLIEKLALEGKSKKYVWLTLREEGLIGKKVGQSHFSRRLRKKYSFLLPLFRKAYREWLREHEPMN